MVHVKLINIDYIFYHLSLSGGWNYVVEKLQTIVPTLEKLLDEDDIYEENTEVYIDTFLDKTFLWGPNNAVHVYKDPWMGVIHHPPDLHNSCFELLLKENFRKSLKTCLGIIVLSQYLADRIYEFVLEHEEIFPKFPQIHVLHHPFVNRLNSMSSSSKRKRILLHMGQHGRNYENFYHVSCPLFNKYFLTNDYFIPFHVCRQQMEQFDMVSTSSEKKSVSQIMKKWMEKLGRDGLDKLDFRSSWIWNDGHYRWIPPFPFHPLPNPVPNPADTHLRNRVDDNGFIVFPTGCKHQKCNAVGRLQLVSLHKALQESIVYIHLDDASAVNTVLECVAFCTPLIINRHPAVVEVLGPNYPLYADTVAQVERMLQSGRMEIFEEASRYMKEQVDLTRYEWKQFENGIERIFAQGGWKDRMESVHQDILLMPPCDLILEGGRMYVEAMESFASYTLSRENCQVTQMVKEEYVALESDESSEDTGVELESLDLISFPFKSNFV